MSSYSPSPHSSSTLCWAFSYLWATWRKSVSRIWFGILPGTVPNTRPSSSSTTPIPKIGCGVRSWASTSSAATPLGQGETELIVEVNENLIYVPSSRCPSNFTCRAGWGENPDYGLTSFDSFGPAVLSNLRLLFCTHDIWDRLYQQVGWVKSLFRFLGIPTSTLNAISNEKCERCCE